MKKHGIILTLCGIALLAVSHYISYIMNSFSWGLLYVSSSSNVLGLSFILTGLLLFFKGNWIKEHSRKKSSLLAILISASAGTGCNSLLGAFFAIAFQEPHLKRPVAIPSYATLALIATIAFGALLIHYVEDCKKHPEIKTTVVDFLIAVIYFIPFFCISGTIVHLVTEPLKALLNL